MPQCVQEVRTVLMDDEVVLGFPDVDKVVSFKQECEDNIWVENAQDNLVVHPHVEQLIGIQLCFVIRSINTVDVSLGIQGGIMIYGCVSAGQVRYGSLSVSCGNCCV